MIRSIVGASDPVSHTSWTKQQVGRAPAVLLAILATIAIEGICWAGEVSDAHEMLKPEQLPFLRNDVTVGYIGSIDKYGGNADNWWELYEENGESVLVDVEGPGCIFSFLSFFTLDTTFKFYLDGETTPRLAVKKEAFGKHAPFVRPWADDCRCDAGGVRRSFYPIEFKKSCKITSTTRHIPLKPELLWGFGGATYHQYRTSDGVETWTPGKAAAAGGAARLERALGQIGTDPKPEATTTTVVEGSIRLANRQSKVIWQRSGQECIAAITAKLSHTTQRTLHGMRIRITWDGQPEPAVDCPLGAFFGNELDPKPVRLLMLGMEKAPGGKRERWKGYNYFPMPYWKSARIELVNDSGEDLEAAYHIRAEPASAHGYEKDKCGYFHVSYREPRTSEKGQSVRIGQVRGRGRLVAALVTAHRCSDDHPEEGDVHVTIDGNRSPRVESDGSESWILYGPGFRQGPQSNPFSGYASGEKGIPWSMVRQLLGDYYPFESELTFDIEHGENDQNEMVHSGALFYYGQPSPGIVLTDSLDVGNEQSERVHAYRAEDAPGRASPVWRLASHYEREKQATEDDGRTIAGHSEFTVRIDPRNDGVRLRRASTRSGPARGRGCRSTARRLPSALGISPGATPVSAGATRISRFLPRTHGESRKSGYASRMRR